MKEASLHPPQPEVTEEAEAKAAEEPSETKRQLASELKERANALFVAASYDQAVEAYEEALAALPSLPELPPLPEDEEPEPPPQPVQPGQSGDDESPAAVQSAAAQATQRRRLLVQTLDNWWQGLEADDRSSLELASQIYSNIGACHFMKQEWERVVMATTNAVDLQPHYVRAILRRATAHRKLERFDEAIGDALLVLEYEPRNEQALQMLRELPELQREQQEKMKDEMLGKLKDLGNGILGHFGLSLNNFQAVQDPSSGSYSISFKQ